MIRTRVLMMMSSATARVARAIAALKSRAAITTCLLVAASIALSSQSSQTVDWPTHYGDYSGRRYSPLAQITSGNVKNLALAWVYRASAQEVANSGGEYKTGDPYYWGGPQNAVTIKATPLMRDDVLYLAAPDHAYAVDARTGREIWHYFWRTRGGIHIGNRGVGLRGNAVFFETPDCYVVSLDATTGRERWHK